MTHRCVLGHPSISSPIDEIRVDTFFERGIECFTVAGSNEWEREHGSLSLFDAITLFPRRSPNADQAGYHGTPQFPKQGILANGLKVVVSDTATAKNLRASLQESFRDVKIIWVHRRDTLAQYASLQRAQQTGQWHSWQQPTDIGTSAQLSIPIEDYRKYDQECLEIERVLRSIGETHELCRIGYEDDIETRSPGCFRKVTDFLGVPWVEPAWLDSQKVSPPVETFVSNAAELRAVTEKRQPLAPSAAEAPDAEPWVRFAEWKKVDRNKTFAPCYAPFSAMSFQTDGRVFACCRKPAPLLGDVRQQTIQEIWGGEPAEALRETMRRRSFAPECAVCEHQALFNNPEITDLRKYERYRESVIDPRWPSRFEFNLANTCNLECVQCSGQLSSAIRARQKLPPIPRVYGEEFFAQLPEFFPHLVEAVFLGGEPFLQQECFRVWDAMIAEGSRPRCIIVTNGTVLQQKVERVLEELPFILTVSIDGSTAATVESIRVNAKFERISENLVRFSELARRPENALRMAYCALRSNWQEFGAFCRWADQLDAEVRVQPLANPAHLSLLTLPTEELRPIVDALESEAQTLEPTLGPNRAVYRRWIDALAAHVDNQATDRFRQADRRSRRAEEPSVSPTVTIDPGAWARPASTRREVFGWDLVKILHRIERDGIETARVSFLEWILANAQDGAEVDAAVRLAEFHCEAGKPDVAIGILDSVAGRVSVVSRDLQRRRLELMARVAHQSHNPSRAKVALEELRRLDPIHFAHVLRSSGRLDTAEASLREALGEQDDPRTLQRAWIELGWCALERADLGATAKHLQQAEQTHRPATPDLLHLHAHHALAAGRLEGARRFSEQMQRVAAERLDNDGVVEAVLTQVVIQRRVGDPDGALSQLHALSADPARSRRLRRERLALEIDLAIDFDRLEVARQKLMELLTLSPRDEADSVQRAHFLRRLGRVSDARQLLEPLLESTQDARTALAIHVELGWCCTDESQYAEAWKHVHEARAAAETEPVTLLHLTGWLHRIVGEGDQASKIANRIGEMVKSSAAEHSLRR